MLARLATRLLLVAATPVGACRPSDAPRVPEGARPPVETVREVARLADSLVLPAREWVRLRAPAPLRAPGTANALCLWPAAPLRPDSAGPPPSLFNNYTVRLRGGPAGRRDELTAYVADGYGRGEALFIPLAPAGVGVRAEERQELAGALCLGPGPGRLDVPSAPYTEAVLSSYSPLTLRRVEWRSAGPLRPAAPPPALQPAACGSRQGAAAPPPAGTRWRTLLVWDGGRRARRLEMALPAAFVVRVDRGRDDVRVTASSPDSLREIRVGFGAGGAAGPPAAPPR